MTALTFTVHGRPAPQGSKDQFGREASKYVRPWREAVKAAALDAIQRADWPRLDGPAGVVIVFAFRRPATHFRTGKHAHELRDGVPFYFTGTPDTDKLLRSTFDAMTDAGIWRDDRLAANVSAVKVYEGFMLPFPGASISVSEATP